jgi:hypothetical protein
MRDQRDTAWEPLKQLWYPQDMGGEDLTFAKMPEHVKIDLVNAMAKGPAFWSAQQTMKKTDTKISTWRHELAKKPMHKRKQVPTRTRTNTQTHIC